MRYIENTFDIKLFSFDRYFGGYTLFTLHLTPIFSILKKVLHIRILLLASSFYSIALSQSITFEKFYDYSVINPEGHPEEAIEEVEKIIKKETEEDEGTIR